MMDASILLPPTGTPLTGIDFVKRLPCGDVERTRRVSDEHIYTHAEMSEIKLNGSVSWPFVKHFGFIQKLPEPFLTAHECMRFFASVCTICPLGNIPKHFGNGFHVFQKYNNTRLSAGSTFILYVFGDAAVHMIGQIHFLVQHEHNLSLKKFLKWLEITVELLLSKTPTALNKYH